MNNSPTKPTVTTRPDAARLAADVPTPDANRRNLRRFAWAALVLVVCFSWPLYQLVRFSVGNELYTHIPLVPIIGLYFAWQYRARVLSVAPSGRLAGASFLAAGIAVGIAYALRSYAGSPLPIDDSLAWTTTAFVLSLIGLCGVLLGTAALRVLAFPFGMQVFAIPMPTALLAGIENLLQHGSAAVAYLLFDVARTPLLRDGLVFQVPGITLAVAPECSGIHSTLALLITSIIAGRLFLRSNVSRVVLAFAVAPLAIVRNGFRVFTIGELCAHIGPEMVNSYIHRHGGPIFFGLSLLPFGVFLWCLMRLERTAMAAFWRERGPERASAGAARKPVGEEPA